MMTIDRSLCFAVLWYCLLVWTSLAQAADVSRATARTPLRSTTPAAPLPQWSKYPQDKARFAVFEQYLQPQLVAQLRRPITDAQVDAFVRDRAGTFELRGAALPLALYAASTIDAGAAAPDSTRLVSAVDLTKSPALLREIRRAFRVQERDYYFNAMLTTAITRDDNASRARGQQLYLPTQSLLVTVAAKNHRRVAAFSPVGDQWVKLWDVDPRRVPQSEPARLRAQLPLPQRGLYHGGYAAADLAAPVVEGRWLPPARMSATAPRAAAAEMTPASALLTQLAQSAPRSKRATVRTDVDAQVAVVPAGTIPLDNASIATTSVSALSLLSVVAHLPEPGVDEAARQQQQAIEEARQAWEEANAALEVTQRRHGTPAGGLCQCLPGLGLCVGCCAGQAAVAMAALASMSASCHAASDLCPWCHLGCGITSAVIMGTIGGQTAACLVGCSSYSTNQCAASSQACNWAAEQSNSSCAAERQKQQAAEQAEQEARRRLEELQAAGG